MTHLVRIKKPLLIGTAIGILCYFLFISIGFFFLGETDFQLSAIMAIFIGYLYFVTQTSKNYGIRKKQFESTLSKSD